LGNALIGQNNALFDAFSNAAIGAQMYSFIIWLGLFGFRQRFNTHQKEKTGPFWNRFL
jgi:hypothetical protein